MSGTPYIDSDTLDQCLQALRDGRTLDDLAGKLNVDTEHLGRLLQLPTCGPVTPTDQNESVDLWAADRLDGVL